MIARNLVAAVVLIAAAAAPLPVAAQYNQFPQVPPPVPSPSPAPSPPAIAPGLAVPQSMSPPSQPRSPQLVPRASGPPVEVPRVGRNNSFGDRATRCMHYGTAAGVPPGEIGAFTRDCVNK